MATWCSATKDGGCLVCGSLDRLADAVLVDRDLVHVLTKIYQRHVELWEEEELLARRRMRRPDPRR
jgi:hypothetical protein